MTVGLELKQARNAKKLTLAQISEATKIQPWVLEALEEDRLHEMMSPIYVKGFLVTYAKFLRLDPEPLLGQLALGQPEEEYETEMQAKVSFAGILSALPPGVVRRTIRIAIACAAVVGIVLLNPLQWLPKVSLSQKTQPQLATLSPVRDLTKTDIRQITLEQGELLELSITARRPTWVRLRADGKLIAQQYLERGANEKWSAKRQLELIVAKPSQVELTLNGKPLTSFAMAYQGRLIITREGIRELPKDSF